MSLCPRSVLLQLCLAPELATVDARESRARKAYGWVHVCWLSYQLLVQLLERVCGQLLIEICWKRAQRAGASLAFFFFPLLFYFFITQLHWSLMPLVASGGAVRSWFCCFALTGETCLHELLGKQAPRQFKQKPVMEVSSTEASSRSPAGSGWLDFTLVTCTETLTFTEVVEEEEWGSFYYSFKVQPVHYFSHKLWCIFSTSAGRQLGLLNFLPIYLWVLPSQDRWQHVWSIYRKTKELQDLEFRLTGLSQLSPLRRGGGTAFLKWHCNYTCIFNQKCILV